MIYLDELTRNAGVEIAAVELASRYALSGGPSCAQLVLDDAAMAEFRQRIAELQREVDDAERCNDIERAAMSRVQLDAVLDELRRTVGIAGRSRSFGNDAERARVSVRKAITRAIGAVARVDAPLGDELSARVVTGARCRFV
jgi:hypothetical protein